MTSEWAAAPLIVLVLVVVLVLESVGCALCDLTAYAHDTGRAKIKSQATRSIEDDDEDEDDLPCYDHLVPSGQRLLAPVHRIPRQIIFARGIPAYRRCYSRKPQRYRGVQ